MSSEETKNNAEYISSTFRGDVIILYQLEEFRISTQNRQM